MGDVCYGILLYVLGGLVAGVALVAAGAIDVDIDSAGIGELGVVEVALALAGGWLGFVGWPVVASWSKGQRSLRRDFGLEIRGVDVGWGLLGGLAALAVSVLAGIVWQLVSGDTAPDNAEYLPSSPGLLGGIALWLLVGVLTPIAEELFFRGLALRAIGRRWGLAVAIPLSSLLFGALHVTGFDLEGAFIVLVTGGYGAVFAWMVVRAHGRLAPAIVAHSLVNTIGVVTLFATSGS